MESKISKQILFYLLFFSLFNFSCEAQTFQLWGMTFKGGSDSSGIIFKINNDGTNFQTKHNFNKATGNYPKGNLIAINGKLFGMTDSGGIHNGGVIFRYDPAFDDYSVLYNFDTIRYNLDTLSGKYPSGSLLNVGNNIVYGMTNAGGINKKGVIFKFDISINHYTLVYNFNGTDGQYPAGSLIKGTDGKLYGMTPLGGTLGFGVIFNFDPATSIYSKHWDFTGGDGANPRGSLLQASDGKFWGLTYGGGDSSRGVLFNFDPTINSYGQSFTFHGINGAYPCNSLYQASDSKLYGTIIANPNGCNTGSVFRQSLAGLHVDVLNFGTTRFGRPYGNVIQGSDGLIYGMTYKCGHDSSDQTPDSSGVIFSLNIATLSCVVLHVFDSIGGANPYGDLLEMPANTGVNELPHQTTTVAIYPNPINTEATVVINNGKDMGYDFIVYNLLGKEVFNLHWTGFNGSSHKINLGYLTQGMYFYKLFQSDQEQIASGKLVIE